MAKLFVIAGHGAGDCGACGNEYQEAERVRALAQRIKDFGGDNVLLGDFNRNYYRDNGISNLTISKDYKILELHMDSSNNVSAKGGHVIIYGGYKADAYDEALSVLIAKMFPGRSKLIVGRTDLANPNRASKKGYNYRLLECGFISNANDVNTFNSRMDELAKGILSCFDIGVNEESKISTPNNSVSVNKSVETVAREVIAGKWGNGTARKTALVNAGYDYDDVQAKVNELLGTKPKLKSITEIAKEVIAGKWGVGAERKRRLTQAGYNYTRVQGKVNELLK